jgi:hypothetical protein
MIRARAPTRMVTVVGVLLTGCSGSGPPGSMAGPDASADACPVPVVVPNRQAIVLARGRLPCALAIDEDTVYWSDYYPGSVNAIAKSGGVPRSLYAGDERLPCGIAVDATSVFWLGIKAQSGTSGVAVLAAPKGGGTSVVIVEDPSISRVPLMISGSSLFFVRANAAGNGSGIWTVSTAGSGFGPAVEIADAYDFTVAGQTIYYSTSTGFRSVDLTTGQGRWLDGMDVSFAQQGPQRIALGNDSLYWQRYCPLPQGSGESCDFTLGAVPLTGPSPPGGRIIRTSTGLPGFGGLVADKQYLYIVEWGVTTRSPTGTLGPGSGSIKKMALCGGEPVTLYTGVGSMAAAEGFINRPVRMEQDETSLYFVLDQQIMKLEK